MQALLFFTEKTRNFKVIPQDKVVIKNTVNKTICLLGLVGWRRLETFIFDVVYITVNVYVIRPVAPVGFNCQL